MSAYDSNAPSLQLGTPGCTCDVCKIWPHIEKVLLEHGGTSWSFDAQLLAAIAGRIARRAPEETRELTYRLVLASLNQGAGRDDFPEPMGRA